MKPIRTALVVVVLFSVILLPNRVSARSSFYLGFGYHHPNYYWDSFPHHRRHSGYYGWGGRHYWRRPFGSSGVRFWADDCRSSIMVGIPIVLESPKVRTKKVVTVKSKKCLYSATDPETQELFERLRNKKSQLLKDLKQEDKDQRLKAIRELAGFTFDDKVRQGLEEILLSDPDPELRKEVAKSFGKARNKNALPALEKVKAEDSVKEVREEAEKALKRIIEN